MEIRSFADIRQKGQPLALHDVHFDLKTRRERLEDVLRIAGSPEMIRRLWEAELVCQGMVAEDARDALLRLAEEVRRVAKSTAAFAKSIAGTVEEIAGADLLAGLDAVDPGEPPAAKSEPARSAGLKDLLAGVEFLRDTHEGEILPHLRDVRLADLFAHELQAQEGNVDAARRAVFGFIEALRGITRPLEEIAGGLAADLFAASGLRGRP